MSTLAHGGNEGEARQRAHDAYKAALESDPRGASKDTKDLKTALDAAVARENTAKGTSGQRRYCGGHDCREATVRKLGMRQ